MSKDKIINDFRVFIDQNFGMFETEDKVMAKNKHYFSDILYGIFSEDEEKAINEGLGNRFIECFENLSSREIFDKYLKQDWMIAQQELKEQRLDDKSTYWKGLEKATSSRFVKENQELLGYHKTTYEELNEFVEILHNAFEDFMAQKK